MDQVFILLGIALVLWAVACLIGLPIIAATHASRISRLTKQLQRLEERLAQSGPAAAPAAPEVRLEEPIQAVMVVPEPPPLPERAPAAPPAPLQPAGAALEAWIGRRGLGWVAVVLLLFATAFFLKQVFAQPLDRRDGPRGDRRRRRRGPVRRRAPLPSPRLAGLQPDGHRRRHRAAVPLHLRRVRILPPAAARTCRDIPGGA